MSVSIPLVEDEKDKWSFSKCSMYDRNYSAFTEEQLLDVDVMIQGGSASNSSGCQYGWKFEFNDPEKTSVVADVRFIPISIEDFNY